MSNVAAAVASGILRGHFGLVLNLLHFGALERSCCIEVGNLKQMSKDAMRIDYDRNANVPVYKRSHVVKCLQISPLLSQNNCHSAGEIRLASPLL